MRWEMRVMWASVIVAAFVLAWALVAVLTGARA